MMFDSPPAWFWFTYGGYFTPPSQYALALHHWDRASRSWSSKNPKQAAEAIRAAGMGVEKALLHGKGRRSKVTPPRCSRRPGNMEKAKPQALLTPYHISAKS
jgi:hypothetical protein